MPHKYKTGDAVICINGSMSGQFTIGKTYTVGGKYHEGYVRDQNFRWVGIEADDRGGPNGWVVEHFKPGEGPW